MISGLDDYLEWKKEIVMYQLCEIESTLIYTWILSMNVMITCDGKVISNMWLWCDKCEMTFKEERISLLCIILYWIKIL